VSDNNHHTDELPATAPQPPAVKTPQPADLRPWPEQITERIVALEAAVNRLTDEVEYLRMKKT
jgi:hypothetical protein